MTKGKSNNEEKVDIERAEEDPAEDLHPLERKFGKEPKIKDEDLWKWH